MLKVNRAYWILLFFCAVLALFPLAFPTSYTITESLSPLFQSFPHQIAEWNGRDTALDEKTYEILETRNVLSREYVHGDGAKVHLLLVSSRKDRRVAHPPEVCYAGSNFSVTESGHDWVSVNNKKVAVKTFVAESELDQNYKEKVIYVYKVGNRYTENYYAQQVQFALDRLTRQDTEILLIRIAGNRLDAMKDLLGKVIRQIESQ